MVFDKLIIFVIQIVMSIVILMFAVQLGINVWNKTTKGVGQIIGKFLLALFIVVSIPDLAGMVQSVSKKVMPSVETIVVGTVNSMADGFEK